jgi:hypothetical protein
MPIFLRRRFSQVFRRFTRVAARLLHTEAVGDALASFSQCQLEPTQRSEATCNHAGVRVRSSSPYLLGGRTEEHTSIVVGVAKISW